MPPGVHEVRDASGGQSMRQHAHHQVGAGLAVDHVGSYHGRKPLGLQQAAHLDPSSHGPIKGQDPAVLSHAVGADVLLQSIQEHRLAIA
eukprot:CAMPEP_0175578346 /NCGR_PEP_ID=MMETSP0096-20121207/46044_1 /TAXON_ID=311494 /ORGANISM="Alexandrium monilatum, Strain CCMP3105" /LENGTH=88 /DNA_ID=CAMNT_0016881925 /DNA_START=297 /DNA_END=563 /DNA_ORIENTATION=+